MKMKKRLFFLILLAFLLCGCSANVNITINGDTVSERITIKDRCLLIDSLVVIHLELF